MNLVDRLYQNASDEPALIDASRQVSFRDLAATASAGASFLQDLGLETGDAVVVLHPINITLYEILLSCFHAGLIVVLIDPARDAPFVRQCLDRIQPRAFIGSAKAHLLRFRFPLPQLAIATSRWVPFAKTWQPALDEAPTPPISLLGAAPALITFTSGSTGRPKGVARSHEFLLAQDEFIGKSLKLAPGQRDLVTLPVFALSNLSHGVTSIIADTDLRHPGTPDPIRILSQVSKYQVTRCTASPAFFEALPDHFFTGLTQIYTGGAPVFSDLLLRFPEITTVVYGSSEAEPISHLEATDADIKLVREGHGLPVGRPIPEIQLRIIDDEIQVAGRHVLPGYLDGIGDEDNKICEGDTIWHRTGDAGKIDRQGCLWLLGRRSQKWESHYPLQIEAAVRAHHPGTRCAFYQGTLYLEKGLTIDLPHLPIERTRVIKKIPLDPRHNAKVDYTALPK